MFANLIVWAKSKSLILKMSLITLLVTTACVFILAFVLVRFANKQFHDSYSSIGLVIGQQTETELNNNHFILNSTDLAQKFSANLLSTFPSIKEINIINNKGLYLLSSEKNNSGKIASRELLSLIIDNNKELVPVSLSIRNSIINTWQYNYKLQGSGNSNYNDMFAQILFNPENIGTAKNQLVASLFPIGFIIFILFLIATFIFYKLVSKNISQLNNNAELADIDGEFSDLAQNINSEKKKYDRLQDSIDKLNIEQRLKSNVKENKAEVHDFEHYNQVLIGIKVLNFDKTFAKLSANEFSDAVTKFYNFCAACLTKFNASLLHFNGQDLLVSLKGDAQMKHSLILINELKNKASSFAVEQKVNMASDLKFIFLISTGNISIANIKIASGRYFSVLGGMEAVQSLNILSSLDHGEIWANADLKEELKNLCYITDEPQLGNFWSGFSNGLISITFEAQAQSQKTTDKHIISENKIQKKTKSKGILGILDDTLSQK